MPSAAQATAVVAAVLYGSLSLSMAFVNKAVISQYKFNYPFFLLACQMLITICVLEALRASGKVSLPPLTVASVKVFLLPSLCYSMHATLSLIALEGMNIPMYGALKRCTPLVNLVLSVVYLKKPVPSPLLITSVFTITFGCLVAGIVLNTVGGFMYTYTKYKEEWKKRVKIDLGDGGIQHTGWELKEKLGTKK